MNLNEYQRTTNPTLPKIDETNTRTIIRLLNQEILRLHKLDEDKEKRIRVLEEQIKKGTGKNAATKLFGSKWQITFLTDGTDQLDIQYRISENHPWQPGKFTFTP